MKPKRFLALLLSVLLIALCITACGGSDSKTQSSDDAANTPAEEDAAQEEPTADPHAGMVAVNLIKSITTVNTESGKESRCDITRDAFGNAIECKQTNSLKKDFTAVIKDEIDTAGKYTVTMNHDGDVYMEYIFGDDGKLTEISYHTSSSKLTFTYAPAGTDVEGAVYYSESVSDSRTKKFYYNEKYQCLYEESQSKGKEATWYKYYYKEDGKVEKRDSYTKRGLETEDYCEAGRHKTRNTYGEVLTECTVERDASGRIVKENHDSKIYTYEYYDDGTVKVYGFAQVLNDNMGEVGSTTTCRADGSVETDFFYQVNRYGTRTEQTVSFDTFYVRDDALLIAFFKMADDQGFRGGNEVSDTCFGLYCSLETLSYR